SMKGSSALTLATSSRSSGLRSMPAMSTARRGGFAMMMVVALSCRSDSIVTREYSGAGQMRTPMIPAPRAISWAPSSRTRLPCRSSSRRFTACSRSCQQLLSHGCLRQQRDLAGFVGQCLDAHDEIGARHQPGRLFRPLGQLQAGSGEDVAKARVFPFTRIVEAEEIEVPDRQPLRLVRLDYRVRRAFHPPRHTRRGQRGRGHLVLPAPRSPYSSMKTCPTTGWAAS